MAVQRFVQGAVLLALVVVALFVLGRGLVFVTGGNSIVGRFAEGAPRGGCPQTDNCVSSHATDDPWAIDPIACDATADEALAAFDAAVTDLPDVEVVEAGSSYVVYSRIFRFPDDVRVEASSRGLEVLSASRLGAGDLGVNRARVERLREAVAEDARC